MYPVVVNRKLPELIELERLIQEGQGRVTVLDHVGVAGAKLPIHKIVFGNPEPDAPVLALIAGVHGLERIGTNVVLALMKSLQELMQWDQGVQQVLQEIRVVFIPIVNPGGMLQTIRSNPRGVDLMRNAPVDAGREASFLVGGQRLSSRIPWYRGDLGSAMEAESQAVVNAVKEEIFPSKAAISVDFHSGFGVKDQIWFPYAKTLQPFPSLAEVFRVKALLDKTYPHHFYKIEPQAKHYRTHGDLWDYLYDGYREQTGHADQVYLPLTLEMGSWLWVKKNPRQFFSSLGPFNPILPHRRQRILRRHNTLFDFLLRSVRSHAGWSRLSRDNRLECEQKAKAFWYGE